MCYIGCVHAFYDMKLLKNIIHEEKNDKLNYITIENTSLSKGKCEIKSLKQEDWTLETQTKD